VKAMSVGNTNTAKIIPKDLEALNKVQIQTTKEYVTILTQFSNIG
jgi:hypothetical protein